MLSPAATLGGVGRGRLQPPGIGPPLFVFLWRIPLRGTTAGLFPDRCASPAGTTVVF